MTKLAVRHCLPKVLTAAKGMARDRDSRQGVRAWLQDEVPAETDHLNAIAEVDMATDSESDGPPDIVESSDEDFDPGLSACPTRIATTKCRLRWSARLPPPSTEYRQLT